MAIAALLATGCFEETEPPDGSGATSGATETMGTSGGTQTGGTTTTTTTGPTTTTSSSGGDTGGGMGGAQCEPLPPPQGGAVLTVGPQDAAMLPQIVLGAETGTTILLEPGSYQVSSGSGNFITVAKDGISIRSQTGNRDDVRLDLTGASFEAAFYVQASDVTIAEITIRNPGQHAIHVVPPMDRDITGLRVYGVLIEDATRQAIKINPPGNDANSTYADDGEVACSTVRLTDAGRPNVFKSGINCHAGAVYGLAVRGWRVRDNTFEGLWCTDALAPFAVIFQSNARDNVIERNRLYDCARGLAFGLFETNGGAAARDYTGEPPPPDCSYNAGHVEHFGGVIRNNFVWAGGTGIWSSSYKVDVGIGLAQACGAQVVHNTVYTTDAAAVGSIDYRFSNTTGTVGNNLVSHDLVARDGVILGNDPAAGVFLTGNITNVAPGDLVDPDGGDLHLTLGASARDAGEILQSPVADDIDGDPRDDGTPDVGADEFVP